MSNFYFKKPIGTFKKIKTLKKECDSHSVEGFNLIELMVVMAMMAILAAIALPAYSHYINRSRVVSAMMTIDPVRSAVTEYAMLHNGDMEALDNAALGMSSEDIVEGSKDLASVTVQAGSGHEAEIKAVLADQLGRLTWTGIYNIDTGHMNWVCTYPAGSALARDVPHECTADS